MADVLRARSSDYVQSLERGLAVIRAFDAETAELTLSDVARGAGLSRETARRMLLTLVELGYVRSNGSLFSLRPRVLELGYAFLSGLQLPEVAQPHMESLVARVNESSSVSVLDDTDIVYAVRVPTRRIMAITLAVGTRLPAYPTSMGRVLLAALPPDELDERLARTTIHQLTPRTVADEHILRERLDRVRHQGWAAVDQELEEGVRSAAVPLRDASGAVVAALNVSAHASRTSMHALRRDILPVLLQTGAAIDAELRSVAGPGGRRRTG